MDLTLNVAPCVVNVVVIVAGSLLGLIGGYAIFGRP